MRPSAPIASSDTPVANISSTNITPKTCDTRRRSTRRNASVRHAAVVHDDDDLHQQVEQVHEGDPDNEKIVSTAGLPRNGLVKRSLTPAPMSAAASSRYTAIRAMPSRAKRGK
jgi:hypothetical protein